MSLVGTRGGIFLVYDDNGIGTDKVWFSVLFAAVPLTLYTHQLSIDHYYYPVTLPTITKQFYFSFNTTLPFIGFGLIGSIPFYSIWIHSIQFHFSDSISPYVVLLSVCVFLCVSVCFIQFFFYCQYYFANG